MPFLLSMQSQIHELDFSGRSNFIGDVGPTTYVAPNEPVVYFTNGTKSKTFVACVLYTVYNHIK
jgi:hypothetical protein